MNKYFKKVSATARHANVIKGELKALEISNKELRRMLTKIWDIKNLQDVKHKMCVNLAVGREKSRMYQAALHKAKRDIAGYYRHIDANK